MDSSLYERLDGIYCVVLDNGPNSAVGIVIILNDVVVVSIVIIDLCVGCSHFSRAPDACILWTLR